LKLSKCFYGKGSEEQKNPLICTQNYRKSPSHRLAVWTGTPVNLWLLTLLFKNISNAMPPQQTVRRCLLV